MATIVGIISRRGLTIEARLGNQSNKSKLALCKPFLHFTSHSKQLYISNKIDCFSNKGRCVIVGVQVLRCLKEELAWAADKWLQVISSTKKVKNKVDLSLNTIVCVAMWSLVTYSNCLVIYY